jgi:hypothetical protein
MRRVVFNYRLSLATSELSTLSLTSTGSERHQPTLLTGAALFASGSQKTQESYPTSSIC